MRSYGFDDSINKEAGRLAEAFPVTPKRFQVVYRGKY
jgi:hypothetical protein